MPTTAAQMLRARALKILHQPTKARFASQTAEEYQQQLSAHYLAQLRREGAPDDDATARMSRVMVYMQALDWLESAPEVVATLENWQLLETDEGLKVRAQRYGQQGRPDGATVTTSRLVALNTQQLQTRNSVYALGAPQPGQQEELLRLCDLLGQLRFVRG